MILQLDSVLAVQVFIANNLFGIFPNYSFKIVFCHVFGWVAKFDMGAMDSGCIYKLRTSILFLCTRLD